MKFKKREDGSFEIFDLRPTDFNLAAIFESSIANVRDKLSDFEYMQIRHCFFNGAHAVDIAHTRFLHCDNHTDDNGDEILDHADEEIMFHVSNQIRAFKKELAESQAEMMEQQD